VIRTFLFDMGNVLVHFSHDRMCRQIGALCGRTGYELREHLMDSGRQWDFERGLVSPDDFHTWFETTFKTKINRHDLAHAASDIFTLNTPIVSVLDELKSRGYRLVLLSNTSVFHYEFVRDHFPVLDRFDDFVLSFEVQSMKPDPEIYEAALKKIGCDAPDCFYTDDIPQYVDQGRHHGLDAEVFTTVDSLKLQLTQRGIIMRGGVIV
jgi:HAD superfamily hydrolase (TIGR01509 family)